MSDQNTGTANVPADSTTSAVDTASVILPSEQQQDQQVDTLLAGKYKTPQELEKAYKELEKKLGAPREPEKPADAPKKPTDPNVPELIPEGVADAAGLNIEALTAEYAETGDLSEASYEALKKVGIPKEMVADYIAGQEARGKEVVSKVHELVGGEAQYSELIKWAATNLTTEDREAFNKSITGDFASQKLAVSALQAQYIKKEGKAPSNLLTGTQPAAGPTGYESRRQMINDMGDSRYKTDPAFRAKVIKKLEATTAF
jgi:hypothetical protein